MIERSHKQLEPVDRIVSPEEDVKTSQFEATLRPQSLAEYIGQEELKRNLIVSLEAAKKRGEPLDHLLLNGPPGLGKTTLANVIAYEMGVNIKVTSGPALEKQGDLASIISNLQENDILFIDEIHRLKPVVEEVLYTAMEDFGIDIMLGKGPSARAMRINLPKFTLIGATTKMSMLSSPLRDRFGHLYKLQFYSTAEIQEIVVRSARILKYEIDPDAAMKLAESSRRTPRIANRLLKRMRDFAQVSGEDRITLKTTEKGLKSLGIDHLGLDHTDLEILQTLIHKYHGGPVGLNTLASTLSEEEETLEDVYEPYLLKLGFLERTPRGRLATDHAYKHLGLEMPKPQGLGL